MTHHPPHRSDNDHMKNIPAATLPAAHELLTSRPELDGVGITDALLTAAAA